MNARSTWILTFIGWLLFTVSAAFFTVSAARNGDLLDLLASLAFLLACVMFIVPAWANRPGDR